MAKELTKKEIWTQFEIAVEKTNKSLSENQENWLTRFNGYRLSPSFIKKDKEKSLWINAYNKTDGIRDIEKKTPLSLYISTQGSASLRFDGRKIITDIKIGKNGNFIGKWAPLANERSNELKVILPDIHEENGDPDNCIDSKIIDIVNRCFNEETKEKDGKKENYYESRILRELQGNNGFYRWMYPVKRIIVREEKKKNEVGLYQVATAIKASDLSFKYSGPKGGGIDVLARRGKGKREQVLSLFELKKEYKRPEVVMQQLIAYGVFLCNLIDSDPVGWGKEFGYTGKNGYSIRELNLVVMMPTPYKGKPRTDFLEHPFIEITTYIGNKYCLNLHYAFFSPEDVRKVNYTSLPSLDCRPK